MFTELPGCVRWVSVIVTMNESQACDIAGIATTTTPQIISVIATAVFIMLSPARWNIVRQKNIWSTGK